MKGKIFNTQEVQATLAGNKTMFREVIKAKIKPENYSLPDQCGMELLLSECRYKVGEKIFVKEVHCKSIFGKAIYKDEEKEIRGFGGKEVVVKWKPGQHMKQEHARLFLIIKEIRVERLQDISEKDAIEEGVIYPNTRVCCENYIVIPDYNGNPTRACCYNPIAENPSYEFRNDWNANHKKPEEKFEGNPFVWVIEFKLD